MSDRAIDVIRAITSAGGQIVIPRKGVFDIRGPATAGMVFGPLSARLRGFRNAYDEVCAVQLGGEQHEPNSTLGRLVRNLLTWRRGEKVQIDQKPVHNLRGMVDQIYAAIKASPAGEPNDELSAMILAFKGIIGLHEWKDAVVDWPAYECPPVRKGSAEDPNRNIPELPPPGKKKDDYWTKKLAEQQSADRVMKREPSTRLPKYETEDFTDDIPF